MPAAWLTLPSSICMLQIISTLMPRRQQSPRSPFVSIVLSTPLSRHSALTNHGTGALYFVCKRLPGTEENICWQFVTWRKVSTSSASHPPTPAWTTAWTAHSAPHVSHINLVSEKSLLRKRNSSDPRFPALMEGPRAQTRNTSAVIHLHWLGGTCQGARVKLFVFKDHWWHLTPCQLHKRI